MCHVGRPHQLPLLLLTLPRLGNTLLKMSWIRAGAALVSQTSSLLSMRALPAAAGARGLVSDGRGLPAGSKATWHSDTAPACPVQARGYAISAATAAVAAAAGGTTFRILGYKVPYR